MASTFGLNGQNFLYLAQIVLPSFFLPLDMIIFLYKPVNLFVEQTISRENDQFRKSVTILS